MKKFSSLLLSVLLIIISSFSVYSADEVLVSEAPVVSAVPELGIAVEVNEKTAIVNGIEKEINPPLLALGKTYVDLNGFSAMLGLNIEWIEDTFGFFRVNKNELTADFKFVSNWYDLQKEPHRLFVRDSVVYASLRELIEISGHTLTYTDGVITIGNAQAPSEFFNHISLVSCDDYIYETYPCPIEHVVYPYQAYSYEMLVNDAEKLHMMYPDLIKTSSIGKSVENRDLVLIEFGKGENKIFVCGAHHAREYISSTYLMYAIDQYAYAYENNSLWGQYNPRAILDNVTYCIVPMVNPDGVNLVQNGVDATTNAEALKSMLLVDGKKYGFTSWKANIHGVDVNWNYDKDWFIERNKNARGSTGFNGEMPNTEPETIAVSQYVDAHSFDAYFSFHTQGQIFYWADSIANPTNIQNAIRKDTGFLPSKDAGSGIGGSFFDYVYRKYDKPTITVELCPYVGPYPYPDENFDNVWAPAKNILLVAGNEIIYTNSLRKAASEAVQ